MNFGNFPGRNWRCGSYHLPKFVQNVWTHNSGHNNLQVHRNLRNNGDICYFTIGWFDCVSEKLKMGDSCIIELNNDQLPVVTVYKVCATDGSLILYMNCNILYITSIFTKYVNLCSFLDYFSAWKLTLHFNLFLLVSL